MAENETPVDLETMTVVQLRQHASANNIQLSSMSLTKAEIIAEIQAASEAPSDDAPAVEPTSVGDTPASIEAVIASTPANLLERTPPTVPPKPKCDRCQQEFEEDELTTVTIDRADFRVQNYCEDCVEKVFAAYGPRAKLAEA